MTSSVRWPTYAPYSEEEVVHLDDCLRQGRLSQMAAGCLGWGMSCSATVLEHMLVARSAYRSALLAGSPVWRWPHFTPCRRASRPHQPCPYCHKLDKISRTCRRERHPDEYRDSSRCHNLARERGPPLSGQQQGRHRYCPIAYSERSSPSAQLPTIA